MTMMGKRDVKRTMLVGCLLCATACLQNALTAEAQTGSAIFFEGARLIVGGRSDAALRRAGRYGDGWVGAWCSVDRYAKALAIIDETAAASGREVVPWQHGYQPWVGVGDTRYEARSRVQKAMEAFYKAMKASVSED